MIKLYLLNDSPLYGQNKPKIWIHSKYELNARKWRDFQSRIQMILTNHILVLLYNLLLIIVLKIFIFV